MAIKWRQQENGQDVPLGWNLSSGIAVLLDLVHIWWGFTIAFLTPVFRLFYPTPMKDLDHEIILVTGAGNGMGKEMCLYLGESCPNSVLVLWDINKRDNDNVVADLRSRGIPAYGYQVDVSDRDKIRAAAEQVRHEVGNVSIIVNNAGVIPPAVHFWDMNAAVIEKTYQINVLSHYWILKEFLPNMMEKNHGHVVGTSSLAGLVPNDCAAVYCGSKYAVRGFMDSLRMEIRSKKLNIKVSTVFPGAVNTDLLKPSYVTCKYPLPIGMAEPRDAAIRIVDSFRKNVENIYVPDYRVWVLALFKNILPQRACEALDDVFNYHLELKKTGVEEESGNRIVMGNGSANREVEQEVIQPEEFDGAPENEEVEIENNFENNENRIDNAPQQDQAPAAAVLVQQRNKKQARKGNA